MKKQTFLAAGAVIGALIIPGAGASAETGDIDTTGPNSNNQITFNTGDSCYIINTNTIYLTNTNQQISNTGQVSVTGNTGSANATSGDAGNINNATFQGVITNTGTCGAAPVVQPQTPVTPTPTPEQPQVQSAQTTAAAPQVKAPVGGVAAGVGSTDTTGALVGALAAGVAAIGFGLRRFAAIRK